MNITLHPYDLPDTFTPSMCVAIDTEAMGLNIMGNRLCVVQLNNGDNDMQLVHFPKAQYHSSPNLVKLLTTPTITKLFHFARFDVGILQHTFKIDIENIFCTKIASRLSRTFTNHHGLKNLCKDLLDIDLSKTEQTSDWGAHELSKAQKIYAATDVLYLHQLYNKLTSILEREEKQQIAQACFKFLPMRAKLDTLFREEFDIFSH